MKKLLIFLMIAIPLVIILIVNLTVNAVIGSVSISVDRITLDKTEITATIDDIVTLKPTIYPENASNKEIIWESTNETVAKVDANGNITFVGFGEGFVKATTVDGNKSALCHFYATDNKVHQVILVAPQKEIHVGKEMQLNATVLPAEALPNTRVTFVSDNPEIATVDPNGRVQAQTVGRATITVIAQSTLVGSEELVYRDFVTISVINPVERIELNAPDNFDVTADREYRIGYKIYPENASNKNVTLTVDNEDIATVATDKASTIIFKKRGEVNVTVTTIDGGFSQTMKVVFTDGYAYSLTLEKYRIDAMLGDADIFLSFTTVPNNLRNTSVVFSSDNEDVAYVTSSGYLSFVGGGSTIIRAKVETSEGEYIENQITVFVESPAVDIILDNTVTAEKTIQLAPKSYPENSTNTKFFYRSNDTSIADVDENGLVTFVSDRPATASIRVWANEYPTGISKEIKVIYTGGKATDFELVTQELNLMFGEMDKLEYIVQPSNAQVQDLKIEIYSSESANKEDLDQNVIEILADNSILAVGGGNAVLKVSLEVYDVGTGKLTTVEEFCQVNVDRLAEDIEIVIDLEKDKSGQYVTSEKALSFSAKVLPLDVTLTDVTWSIDDRNIAVLTSEQLRFNQTGTIVLTATNGDVQKSVEIRYTGSYPDSAEVWAEHNGEFVEIPSVIGYGEEYDIAIKSIFPSNTTNKNITLKVSNQITSSIGGKVLEINGTTIRAVGGGRATLNVYVSSVLLTFEITVERHAESIDVSPKNIQTTKTSIDLQVSVLPIDTTDKSVVFEVDDESIATIEGTTLVFKQNGLVTITVTSLSNNDVNLVFTIQKIEKEPELIEINRDSANMTVGDMAVIDFSSDSNAHHVEVSLLTENSVLTINGGVIKAISKGEEILQVKVFNSENSLLYTKLITFTILQLVEQIQNNCDIEVYNEEYVTAKGQLELDFEALPNDAENKELDYEIISSYTSSGMNANIAYINKNDNVLNFTQSGFVVLRVSSKDGNAQKDYTIRYTGGDAIDAEINVGEVVNLNVGDSVEIKVTRWIPSNTEYVNMGIRAVGNANVIAIDSKTNTITAKNSGECKVIVDISGGLTKQISIVVNRKVTGIEIEDYIISAKTSFALNPVVLPLNATDKSLDYIVSDTDIATMDGNIITFKKAGKVSVTIKATDGSGIEKVIEVESTFGKISQIVLSETQKTINKGQQFVIQKPTFYPLDAEDNEILVDVTHYASNNDFDEVITYQDGLVTGVNGGRAVIKFFAKNNMEVYAEFEVIVFVPVENFDMVFDHEMDKLNNAFFTSQKEITFAIQTIPSEASEQQFTVAVSDNSIAEIQGNKIVFKAIGRVTLTFESLDKTFGKITKSYAFFYNGDSLTQAELDTTSFVGNTLYMQAGDGITLGLKNVIPSDNKNITMELSNLVEERIDNLKQVISFRNGRLEALNGGKATFTLKANNINLGEFVVVVTREATGIETDSLSVVVSQESYKITAWVTPTDANDKTLTFRSSDDELATVSGDGLVNFSRTGKVTITIFLDNNPDVFIEVEVEFTRELRDIVFNEVSTSQYVGNTITLYVLPMPLNVENFSYTMTIDNPEIANFAKSSNGYILQGKNEGIVTVTAVADGNENIKATKQFTFFTKINNISLEFDKEKDTQGLVNYHIFGNKYVDTEKSTNEKVVLKNSYKIKYTTVPEGDYSDLINWESSDESIATVDNEGVVTFVGTGSVTITARAIPPYEGASSTFDTYTFKVIDGINVTNSQEFAYAHKYLGDLRTSSSTDSIGAMIMHNDIQIDSNLLNKTINLTYNLYGNGYLLDLSKMSNSSAHVKIQVKTNNVIIDGVTLRAETFDPNNQGLSALQEKSLPLVVTNALNVRLNNSILENGLTCLRLESAEVEMTGCIVRNSFSAGVIVGRIDDNTSRPSTITVSASIFSKSLLGGLMFESDSKDTKEFQSKIILKGNVYFYNWLTLEELKKGTNGFLASNVAEDLIEPIVSSIISNVRSQLSATYAVEHNGEEYYQLGIMNIKKIQAKIVPFRFNANGKVDVSELSQSLMTSNGNLKYEAGIGNLDIDITSYKNTSPPTRPGEDYNENNNVMRNVRYRPVKLK